MLPVLALLLVVPPALGSGALAGFGARAAPTVATPADEPLPPGEAPALGLLDVVSRTAADPHGPVTERDITRHGLRRPRRSRPRPPAPPGLDLARLVISCCAADASAVRLHLADPEGGSPGSSRWRGGRPWVTIRGRVVAGTGTSADGHVPTLSVTAWSPVATPDPVYEY